MKRLFRLLSMVLLILAFTGTSYAALLPRADGMVYDDVNDLTWLLDANYAAGSSYDDGPDTTDGRMSWSNAEAWANSLVYPAYDGGDPSASGWNWRLPTTDAWDKVNDVGHVNLGEMSHLYYDYNISEVNPLPFVNLSWVYWTGTEVEDDWPPHTAWHFNFDDGYQGFEQTENPTIAFYHAMAVHDGDIAAVPVPSAIWLLGSGLIGLVGFRRKLRK